MVIGPLLNYFRALFLDAKRAKAGRKLDSCWLVPGLFQAWSKFLSAPSWRHQCGTLPADHTPLPDQV